jgi:tetratricopeptide (TPR) repeat protein
VRRLALAAAIAALLPALLGAEGRGAWPGTIEWLCTRGIRQYDAGEFTRAREKFDRALEIDPGSAPLHFNRGAASYRQQRHDEASESFAVAAETEDPELARDAAYNLGNTRFSAGDDAGAIEAYKEALRVDPGDGEAKHNLELALQRQQEKQQRQQPGDQQQPPDEDDDAGDEPDRPESPQNQPDEQREGERQQEQSEPEGTDEGDLTEAEARRLLHALASEDAEMQKLIRRAPKQLQPREGEKDW